MVDNARQRLEAADTEITWENFKTRFLEEYFPDDVSSKKEIEFLEPNQRNVIVYVYDTKFEELSRFYLHYNGVGAEGFKCIKFESGLHSEIKKFIRY